MTLEILHVNCPRLRIIFLVRCFGSNFKDMVSNEHIKIVRLDRSFVDELMNFSLKAFDQDKDLRTVEMS